MFHLLLVDNIHRILSLRPLTRPELGELRNRHFLSLALRSFTGRKRRPHLRRLTEGCLTTPLISSST